MLKLKVCGLTDSLNIKQVIELEPEMVGLIFYAPSQRDVSTKNVLDLCAVIPPNIKRVGVFVDSDYNFIKVAIKKYQLNSIQLYHQDISSFQDLRKEVKIIKAIAVHTELDLIAAKQYTNQSDLFLFDTKGEKPGGNGLKFDWRILQNYKEKTPFMLSGGINVNDAAIIKKINHEQFYGIDINSKFEVEPGIKNIKAIQQFKTKLYENVEHNK